MNRTTIPIRQANASSPAFEYFSTKKDEFVASAQQATPESASDAAQKASIVAKHNRLAVIALAAIGLCVLIGRATAR